MDTEFLENWLNHRPRKVLDFRTPYEVFYKSVENYFK